MLDFGFYNMDCMDGMKEYPDKYFDLAVCDPPYGINAPKMKMGSHNGRESTAEKIRKGRLNQGAGKLKNRALNTMNCDWDSERPSMEYFEELFRISKNQIIFGFNYFSDFLPPSRGIIVWDKRQPWKNFSQAEVAWTSFDMPAALVKISSRGGANSEEKIHPTQKPVALYEWILVRYAKEGFRILDTHCGSASSLIACEHFNLDYVGFEISKDFYNSAKERLEAEKAQIRFF